MKKFYVLLILSLLPMAHLRADEGMWLISNIKGSVLKDMRTKGCKLSQEDIYDINSSSLKDAVVGLGFGAAPTMHFCSSEIISGDGLLLTNHHCGYSFIQNHSSLKHNYLKNGFWSRSREEELANPGLSASILEYMEDVTDRFTPVLNEKMTYAERSRTIDSISDAIAEKVMSEDKQVFAHVTDMFEGNQFFLFVYKVYQDVRLVAAPPENLGGFGGDTDNWMWPRHTADFSIFRIYTAPDGSPAGYDEKNIPLKPRHFLPISAKGLKDGDFTMIMGFPGFTDRFATSHSLKRTIEQENAIRYSVRTKKLNILWKWMEKDEQTRLKYASKASQSSNYWKNAYEQNKAFKRLKTMEKKEGQEAAFNTWLDNNPEAREKYGKALELIREGYRKIDDKNTAYMYEAEALIQGAELPIFAYRSGKELLKMCKEDCPDSVRTALKEKLVKDAEKFYKDIDIETDRELFDTLYTMCADRIGMEYLPAIYSDIEEKFNGEIPIFSKYAYQLSIFADKERFMKFIEHPLPQVLLRDMLFRTGESVYNCMKDINDACAEKILDIAKGNRLYVAGTLEMDKDRAYAPNANSTLRLTYGNVRSYSPKDAVHYNYMTTIEGVMEKEDPESYDFTLPDRFKELYKAGEFGPYRDKKGTVGVNFITTNDITGGNSGSPVINAKGELVGIAFDGNSEAMSGDIDFEEKMQRCISVDIRYVLWIIDTYAEADNLIKELDIKM